MPRRLIVSEYLSLDGVMETPAWTMPYWSDEVAAYKRRELFAADALVLGRVTYDGFAAAWPGMTDDDGFADRMNAMPKHVASRTATQADLDAAGWNARLLSSNVLDAISALKNADGDDGLGDLLVFGSADLVRALTSADLVDEYRLLVLPVLVGEGKRLFETEQASLQLASAETFASGIAVLTYHPAPSA